MSIDLGLPNMESVDPYEGGVEKRTKVKLMDQREAMAKLAKMTDVHLSNIYMPLAPLSLQQVRHYSLGAMRLQF